MVKVKSWIEPHSGGIYVKPAATCRSIRRALWNEPR